MFSKANRYVVKKGLVRGYDIGLQSNLSYIPVSDRDVLSFKEYEGPIEAMLTDGQKMIIPDWKNRIIEEVFEDKFGRGKYKIGYFLFKPETEEDNLKELSKLCL